MITQRRKLTTVEMNYSKELVNGYDFLTKLNLLRRRASDTVSELITDELDIAVNCLEDSIFYLEDVKNVHGSLEECIDSSHKYMSSLWGMLNTCSNSIEQNLIRDAIRDAEESSALLEDIKNLVDGYKSY